MREETRPRFLIMPETIIYKEDLASGEVVKLKGKTHRASRELEDFDTRMRNQLYDMECRGDRFTPGEKDWFKRTWFK